ncbi:MAG: hypothetical protein RLY43_8 [Bacteroidota bacterium]|jgi:hypothetical protein
MTNEELGKAIALGIINTGVEGGYDSVSCSTAGDYPSMGASQWEGLNGGRGDTLLSYIDGGEKFIGRTYSDICDNGELDELKELLGSDQGQAAQLQILSQDCTELYVNELQKVENLDDTYCTIYAGIWCPTSHIVVRKFLQKRQDSYDIRNLETLRDIFRDQYYIAADVGEQYAQGYANRAENTYQYVREMMS